MRDAHGHETIFEPYGETYEHDTFQCNHCGAHKRIGLGEPQNVCKGCMGPICDWCYGDLRVRGCRTQEAQFEELEKRITSRLEWERNFREIG